MRLSRMLVAVVAALGCLAVPADAVAAKPPRIRHVFILVLENRNFADSFGGHEAPYLSKTLPKKGQLLTHYYGIGHESLDNYLAMISGQSPNPVTQADCPIFLNFQPGAAGPGGQAVGTGCVYPEHVKTIADQLDAKGLDWKGYMQDMGRGGKGEPRECRHPSINGQDHTQSAREHDQYAARHNPFVYFHSIIDRPSHCREHDVPLHRLAKDLKQTKTTPNYAFITPDLCNDAHDEPCIDGKPGGLVQANSFLRKWVPRILDSPAFKRDGLLIVTFDEAEDLGSHADSSACCNEPTGPNTLDNGGPTPGPGGGRIGAVLVSPFIKPGTVNDTPYNHYSMLRSVEELFRLEFLGYAGQNGLRPFGSDVYNR